MRLCKAGRVKTLQTKAPVLVTKPAWDTERWHPGEREEKKKAATARELDALAPCVDGVRAGVAAGGHR